MRRRDLLRRGGAVAAVPLLLGPRAALAQGDSDAAILESAIGLEQVSAFAYETLAGSQRLDKTVAAMARRFARHERAHADALRTQLEALGGTAPPEPRTVAEVDRVLPGLGAARTQADVLTFAIELESAAVAAYHDAHQRLQDPKILQTAASIMANEGQHLVVLRRALNQEPVPFAFETGER